VRKTLHREAKRIEYPTNKGEKKEGNPWIDPK
jgi:hypothetical protein